MSTTQMQVVVPAGVSPGMPFQVNTPAGSMQVVCPPGAMAGSPMIVNVPLALGVPPVAQAAAAEPLVMGMAVDASHGGVVVVAAQPVASAPVPHTMMHGSMMTHEGTRDDA